MTQLELCLEYDRGRLIAIIKGLLREEPDAKRKALDYLVEIFEDDGLEHLV
jgi:hypothetical protein